MERVVPEEEEIAGELGVVLGGCGELDSSVSSGYI